MAFPPNFNELPLINKHHFAREAKKNNHYLTKIIEWLTDTERVHNQEEDDEIILHLHSKVDDMIANGIVLPPPYKDYFSFSRERKAYLKKYVENPHRNPTESEMKTLVNEIIRSSTNVPDAVDDLINADILLGISFNNS